MRYQVNPRTGPNEPTMIWVNDDGTTGSAPDPGCARMLVVPFLFVLSPLAYPLTAILAAGVAWLASEMIDVRLGILDSTVSGGVALVVGLVVYLIGLRVEQRLGDFAFYRWPRYVLRVLLPAAAFNLIFRSEVGLTEEPTPSGLIADTLSHPKLLIATVVAIGVMIVVYGIGGMFRDDWRYVLMKVRLRSRKLPM